MLAIGVIAVVGTVAAVIRYFAFRDDAPPMQRHARALAALRDLSEHPRPPVDPAVQPEVSIDHVRILDDATADSRRVREPSPTRATSRKRRSARSRGATAERPTIQIRASGDRPRTGSGAERSIAEPTTELRTRPRFAATPVRAYAAGAALVVVAVAGVVAIALSTGARHTVSGAAPTTAPGRSSPSSVHTTVSSSTTSSTAAAVTKPVVAVTPSGATVTAPGPFRLTLAASGACWVQITDPSGTTLFATTMQAGRSQDIPVTRAVTLQLGNAAAMALSVDGAPLDAAALARVTHIEFQPS